MRTNRPRKLIWIVVLLALVGLGAYLAVDVLRKDPLVEGRQALEEGDFRSAVRLLERAIGRGRGSAEVYADLAHAYQFLERHSRAVKALSQAMALRPEDRELVRRFGEALILAGDQEDPPISAAEDFALAYLKQPENARFAHGEYLLGRALQARYTLSMKALEKEIERTRDGPHVWQVLNAVRFALRAQDYFGAARNELIAHLVRQAGFAPTDPIFEQVSALRRLQEAALAALGRAEKLEEAAGHPTFARAAFLLELGQREEAGALCRGLLSPEAKDVADEIRVRAQELLATALAQDPDATDSQLREAAGLWGAYIYGLDAMPGTPRERNLLRYRAHTARGEIFVRLENAEGLAEVATSLLVRDDDNATGLFLRGMASYFRGDYADAELDLNASLTRRPDYVTYSTLGTILAKRGGGVNTEQALQRFRAAARLDPSAIEPILAEVRLYLDLPDPNYMDAHERVRQALRRNAGLGQRSTEVLELRDEIEVNLLKRTKDESYQTPADARAALALHRGSLYPLHYLAAHYEEAGDPKAAEEFAERLYRRAHGQMIASLLYARILLRLETKESLQKAELVLSKAQELDRKDGRPIAMAVRVARARRQGARAWRLLNRVARVDPYDTDSRLEIAQSCYNSGRLGGARYNVDYLLSIMREPPYALRRLDLELKLDEGKADAAALDISALAERKDVLVGDLDYFRGRLNEVQGRNAQAIHCYDRALQQSPDRGRIVVAAARLELAVNDQHAALKRLTAFRSRGGKDAEVAALLGEILMDRWRLDDAMQVFQEMRQINFGDRRGQIGFGLCALYTGKRLGAGLWALQFALQSFPRNRKFLKEARRILRATVFGRLDQKNWTAAVTLMNQLEQLDPGNAARARALLAYFNGDLVAARDLVDGWIGKGTRSAYLRFLRGLLSMEESRTAGVLEDVSAVVPGIRAAPPWASYAREVARELPGFGRIVLATVARVKLLEDDVTAAEEILAAARPIYPADRRLARLAAHVAFRRGRTDDATAALRELGPNKDAAVLRDLAVMRALEGADDAPLLMKRYAASDPGVGEPLLAWARYEAGGDHFIQILATLRDGPRWRWTLLDQIVLVGLARLVDGTEAALSFAPGKDALAGPYLRRRILEAASPQAVQRLSRLVRIAAIGRLPLFRYRAVADLQALLGEKSDEALQRSVLARLSRLVRPAAIGRLPLFSYRAVTDLLALLEHGPSDALQLSLLARLRIDAGRLEAAEKLVDRIDSPEDRALALLARARLQAATPGGIQAAKTTLEELTRLAPKAVVARVALGSVLLDAGRPGDAADVLVESEGGPQTGNPRRLVLFGRALEAKGDPTGAVTTYARALTYAPQDEEIAYRLIRCLLANRSYTEAVAVLARHPRLAAARPDVRLLLGLALVRFDQHTAAEKFLTGFPYSPDAAASLGRIALARRDKEEAIRQFRYAYHLDPKGHRDALLEVAEVQMGEYDFREALATVNELLVRAPHNRAAREMQAQLMERLFKPDEALFGWVRAWLLDRKNARPLLKAAILLRKKGESELAKVLIRQLLDRPARLNAEMWEELERECLYLGIDAPARAVKPGKRP